MKKRTLIKRSTEAVTDLMPNMVRGLELELFSKMNITNSQYIVLMAIYAEGKVSMGQMAKMMHVTMPTVTGIVDRLVALKLLKRARDEKDRRKVYVCVTKKGLEMIQAVKGIIKKRWTPILEELNVEDIEGFLNSLKAVTSVVEKQREESL